ncbi:MAG: hypothetical protein LBR81_10165 [Prevotellaceae bacterium]|jgi:hypothetical protein|nr:hypothetical protein [Prevotellaceae bacterium]
MVDIYKVGNTSDCIQLSVKIGTTGGASTIVLISGELVAKSNHAGCIQNHTLGVASNLIGKTMEICTQISKLETSKHTTNYCLSGGACGTVQYDKEDNTLSSDDGSLVHVTKYIEFVA